MCGRYTVAVDAKELWDELDLEGAPSELPPRYNVAPTQDVPAVLGAAPQRLVQLRWGLIPSWARDASIGNRLINARAESVAEKPAFRRAFERRRCLLPASGFYEWRREGKAKVPTYLRLPSGRALTFAGLWELWRDAHGELLRTCAIITTEANLDVAAIHHRMPVILPPDARARWLAPDADRDELLALLRPYAGGLEHWEVSRRVNTPDNDGPECVLPAEEEQGRLF